MFSNMNLGEAYEQGNFFLYSLFFRFKGVIHSEYSRIIINLKSCDCSLSEYPSYYHSQAVAAWLG
jgi:hypothetical protein